MFAPRKLTTMAQVKPRKCHAQPGGLVLHTDASYLPHVKIVCMIKLFCKIKLTVTASRHEVWQAVMYSCCVNVHKQSLTGGGGGAVSGAKLKDSYAL